MYLLINLLQKKREIWHLFETYLYGGMTTAVFGRRGLKYAWTPVQFSRQKIQGSYLHFLHLPL